MESVQCNTKSVLAMTEQKSVYKRLLVIASFSYLILSSLRLISPQDLSRSIKIDHTPKMVRFIQSSTLLSLSLSFSTLFSPAFANVTYSDNNVLPNPIGDYVRYLTVFGNGTRTYVCNPSAYGSSNFTLGDLNYNLYYAEPTLNTTYLIGRRVFLPVDDYADGNFGTFSPFVMYLILC